MAVEHFYIYKTSEELQDFINFKTQLTADECKNLKHLKMAELEATLVDSNIPTVVIFDDFLHDLALNFEILSKSYKCFLYTLESINDAIEILEKIKPWFYTTDLSLSPKGKLSNYQGQTVIKIQKSSNIINKIPSIVVSAYDKVEFYLNVKDKPDFFVKKDEHRNMNLLKHSKNASKNHLYSQQIEEFKKATPKHNFDFELVKHRKTIIENAKKTFYERINRYFPKSHYVNATFELIGESAAFNNVINQANIIANSDSNTIIEGESGTGKELIARYIHQHSKRASESFVTVNCAAFSENLLESELFGYVKGAFTGAVSDKKGKFEAADNGTLFLDEIGETSESFQAKLLRVLQSGEIQKIGSNIPTYTNTRIIAATNKKLKEEVNKGNFREDLYYRLNVLEIVMPPLRERKEDIPLLANAFCRKAAEKSNTSQPTISEDAMVALKNYDFKGNVRQLENIMERAVLFAEGNDSYKIITPKQFTFYTPTPISIQEKLKELRAKIYSFLIDVYDDDFWEMHYDIKKKYKEEFINFLESYDEGKTILKINHIPEIKDLINKLLESKIQIDDAIIYKTHNYIKDIFNYKIKTEKKKIEINFGEILTSKNLPQKQIKLYGNQFLNDDILRGILWLFILAAGIKNDQSLNILKFFFYIQRNSNQEDQKTKKITIVEEVFGDNKPRNFYKSLIDKQILNYNVWKSFKDSKTEKYIFQ
jgi:transcriptional regulator with PAS, ATPase and Fis domain